MKIETTAELKELLSLQFENKDEKPKGGFKYVIYARKSSEGEDRQERSLKDQVMDCKDLAEKEGLKIVSIKEESKSAKESGKRPIFRQLLEDFQKGKYDGLISWHPNRLARNMKEAGEVIDLLDKGTISDLKFASFAYNNDSNGKMALGINFVLSKQYSDALSDVVSRGNRRSIADGRYINKAKHGYIKDEQGFLRPDGKNFELIKEVFARRKEGAPLHELADFLNKSGYERRNKETGDPYLKSITKQKVQKILTDPIYTGVVVYGTQVEDLTEIYGFVPAVSPSDFMEINKLGKDSQLRRLARGYRSGALSKANLLKKKVLCSVCGEARTPCVNKGSKGKKYFYYRCDTDGCPDQHKGVRANIIVNFVVDYLKQKPFISKEAYEHYREEFKKVSKERAKVFEGKIRILKGQETEIKNKTQILKENISLEKDPTIKKYQKEDLETNIAKLGQIRAQKDSFLSKLGEIRRAPATFEEFIELFEKMPELIVKQKNMKDLDFLIGKIFLNFSAKGKSVYKYTLNPPFDVLERLSVSKCGR